MIFLMHGSQHLIEWNGSDARGVIGQTIRNDELAVVEERAARINDVGHVAFPFVVVGCEQRFAEAADYFGGIIAIEEERTDAVLAHRADTVAEDQPPCIGLKGGSAVPKLDQFPRASRCKEHP